MRRAISPATCTQVTSRPSRVRSQSALRSFESDALSSAALRNAPGKYQRSFTVPSTGERFECTLNTFMNTLTLSASRSSQGSRDLLISTMRPSAGETTARGSSGTSRAGSRKNWMMKIATSHTGSDHHQPSTKPISDATPTAMSANSQPSRAMSGCGYGGFTSVLRRLLLIFLQSLRVLPLLHQLADLARDAVDGFLRLRADVLRLLGSAGREQQHHDGEYAHIGS